MSLRHLLLHPSFSFHKTSGLLLGGRSPFFSSSPLLLRGREPRLGDVEKITKWKYVQEMKTPPLSSDPTTGWDQTSRRTGLVGVKIGMTTAWDEWQQSFPVTLIKIPPNHVVQAKSLKEGYYAVQIGAGEISASKVTKPLLGHFEKAGVPPKRRLYEFVVSPNALLAPGTPVLPQHFLPGQFLDIVGITKGKGFAGAMKRWGFSGGNATHGASLSHRVLGSTGNRKTPGRVWKNKKMPGHMGVERRTVRNLLLWKIDPKENILYVRGAIPGPKGGFVLLKDAFFKRFLSPPPFPTYIASEKETQEPLVAKMPRIRDSNEDVEDDPLDEQRLTPEKLAQKLEDALAESYLQPPPTPKIEPLNKIVYVPSRIVNRHGIQSLYYGKRPTNERIVRYEEKLKKLNEELAQRLGKVPSAEALQRVSTKKLTEQKSDAKSKQNTGSSKTSSSSSQTKGKPSKK